MYERERAPDRRQIGIVTGKSGTGSGCRAPVNLTVKIRCNA